MAKKKKSELGRIVFPGNPWKKGHAINAFEWTGRVERGTGIWFDLHLSSAAYDAEDKQERDEDEDEDEGGSWNSKSVWANYGSCTLSSTYWSGECCGFLAATYDDKLDLKKLSSKTFSFDEKPSDLHARPRPFNIYLLGHDAVSAHEIKFKREPKKTSYSVAWSGKIAMFYVGSSEFEFEFQAKVKGVSFGGIKVNNDEEENFLNYLLRDSSQFRKKKTKAGVFYVPV